MKFLFVDDGYQNGHSENVYVEEDDNNNDFCVDKISAYRYQNSLKMIMMIRMKVKTTTTTTMMLRKCLPIVITGQRKGIAFT